MILFIMVCSGIVLTMGNFSIVASENTSIPPSGRYFYKVFPYETLSGIAYRFYGKTEYWGVLAETNDIHPPETLRADQWIEVPVFEHMPRSWWLHSPYEEPLVTHYRGLELAVSIDIDRQGSDEIFLFDPVFSQIRDNAQGEPVEHSIYGLISNTIERQHVYIRFPIITGIVSSSIKSAVAWQVSPTETFLVVEIWEDNHTARVSATGSIHIFLVKPDLSVKKLLRLSETAIFSPTPSGFFGGHTELSLHKRNDTVVFAAKYIEVSMDTLDEGQSHERIQTYELIYSHDTEQLIRKDIQN
jgi:hypothetical protein